MNQETLLILIQKSFLPEPQKQELESWLNSGASEEQILAKLDDYLAAETERRGESYQQAAAELDQEYARTDQDYAAAKNELEENLTRRLSEIPVSDAVAKDVAWQEYYDQLEKLQIEREKKVKAIVLQQTLSP
ncbi:MAG: hypothetical protein HY978_02425 [Candidatus Liptonbacteria bacterium]|nr:hypothetical protein [Candidatus Liptonbacteria bacterium]